MFFYFIDKPVNAGGFTSCFLAEAQRILTGARDEGRGKTKTMFTLLLLGESRGGGGPVRHLDEMKREQLMTCLGYCDTASGLQTTQFSLRPLRLCESKDL